MPWNQPFNSNNANMIATELVATGTVPMKIMTAAEHASPNAMKTRALLRSDTLPITNFDSP
jgi:hypothetical protein